MRTEQRQQENKRMGTKQSIGNEVTESWAGFQLVLFPFFIFPFPVLVPLFSDMVRYNETVSATSLEVN